MQRSKLITLAVRACGSFLSLPAVYVGRVVRDSTIVGFTVSYFGMGIICTAGPYASHDLAHKTRMLRLMKLFTSTEVSNINVNIKRWRGLACNSWHMTKVAAFSVKSYCY